MFTVRPLQRGSTKQEFRVYVSAASLVLLRLQPGEVCLINETHYAIIWAASEKIQDSIIQTSKPLQELYRLKLGDKVSITRPDDAQVPTATTVRLIESNLSTQLSEQDKKYWQWHLEHLIPSEHEALAANQSLAVKVRDDEREFTVQEDALPLFRVNRETKFIIGDALLASSAIRVPAEAIGGLHKQIQSIQRIINELQTKSNILPPFYRPTQGILIYGAKGTGKSLLIDTIADCQWNSVVRWTPGSVQRQFEQPCLVVIEDLEEKAPSSSSTTGVVAVRDLFKTISGLSVLVVAEVRHPNSVHESLRAFGRFAKEIELQVPTQNDRLAILRAIRAGNAVPDDSWIGEAAMRTHGYVGADLIALLQEATSSAIDRTRNISELRKSSLPKTENRDSDSKNSALPDTAASPTIENAPLRYTPTDLALALSTVRPSALQEIFLETPTTHWSDIGGLHAIKQRLIEAVSWPLSLAEEMKSLNLKPTKGVLLYGPPGCSKTLLVKALATEAGLNFLAVKGAELVSMYVGESERAVREVFRKARSAAPSIVFFDEIDSIAARSGSGRSELNVLTTLLNEMDGFEELKGVLVVAATNKPQVIDPALLRPGRLDSVVFVGLPDEETRTEILKGWFGKSRVQADAVRLAAMTDGYSGAEIVGICETAGRAALRAARDVIDSEDLELAVKETPRGVTGKMLQEFEAWNASRR